MKSRIYPEKCSLSADGRFFAHFHYSPSRDHEKVFAVSRVPYFTALPGCVCLESRSMTARFDSTASGKFLRLHGCPDEDYMRRDLNLPRDGRRPSGVDAAVFQRRQLALQIMMEKNRLFRESIERETGHSIIASVQDGNGAIRTDVTSFERFRAVTDHHHLVLAEGFDTLPLESFADAENFGRSGLHFMNNVLLDAKGNIVFDPYAEEFTNIATALAENGGCTQCAERKCDLMMTGKATKCCKCADLRTPQMLANQFVYLDNYGDVIPAKHGIDWPKDYDYCPSCVSDKTRLSLPGLCSELQAAQD